MGAVLPVWRGDVRVVALQPHGNTSECVRFRFDHQRRQHWFSAPCSSGLGNGDWQCDRSKKRPFLGPRSVASIRGPDSAPQFRSSPSVHRHRCTFRLRVNFGKVGGDRVAGVLPHSVERRAPCDQCADRSPAGKLVNTFRCAVRTISFRRCHSRVRSASLATGFAHVPSYRCSGNFRSPRFPGGKYSLTASDPRSPVASPRADLSARQQDMTQNLGSGTGQ